MSFKVDDLVRVVRCPNSLECKDEGQCGHVNRIYKVTLVEDQRIRLSDSECYAWYPDWLVPAPDVGSSVKITPELRDNFTWVDECLTVASYKRWVNGIYNFMLNGNDGEIHQVLASSVDFSEEDTPSSPDNKCKCPIESLMFQGCQCGGV